MENGYPKAAAALLPIVYEELRRLAARKMANEAAGHTFPRPGCGWVAPMLRPFRIARILIEHARRRLAAKRGAGVEVVDLDEIEIPSPVADDDQLLAVNEALEKFAVLDPRKADLVKLRYFVGMSFEEAATALDIAVPTAKQWWAYARAWLTVELGGGGGGREAVRLWHVATQQELLTLPGKGQHGNKSPLPSSLRNCGNGSTRSGPSLSSTGPV